jgi:transcriptional regulator with XRE-family HTH domain
MARSAPFRRKLRDELRKPEFAAEYASEVQRLRIAHRIATARRAAGLTQAALARRMGTAQPTIARLERGDYQGYSLATLAKAARALGCRLRVELEPARVSEPSPERQTLRKAKRR